jgi:spermidine/putrescine transport system substrate-binding protein
MIMKPKSRIGISLALAVALAGSAAAIATAEDKELVIFDWSGYEAPEFHPGYAAEHGQSPTFTFFGDEDEAFEKIRSGFKTDLAHPCSQNVV